MRLHPSVLRIPNPKWAYHTVEWTPKLSPFLSQIKASHFILPDLPRLYTHSDREEFLKTIPRDQRIQTVAACRHTEQSLIENVQRWNEEVDKLLIVGGHEKNKNESFLREHGTSTGADSRILSTIDAVQVLRDETDMELWGVANPNDEQSVDSVHEKIHSGITGFITQPLLCSHAWNVFQSYPKLGGQQVMYIVGIAMPNSTKKLQFWLELLEQPELMSDSLFRSHLRFFERGSECSNNSSSSLEWVRKELFKVEDMEAGGHGRVEGVHFMPLTNIVDLLDLFKNT